MGLDYPRLNVVPVGDDHGVHDPLVGERQRPRLCYLLPLRPGVVSGRRVPAQAR